MRKVLLVATVQSHIAQFHIPLIEMLTEKGVEVQVAARDNLKEKNGLKISDKVSKVYDVPFSRSPLSSQNIKAYKLLKEIILKNEFDVIHCNTPVGGIIPRIIKKKEKINSKIFYTVHGFHFYKGGPIKSWLIYYPIEKYFSKYTDCIITINDEDYMLAKTKMKAKSTKHINGVGVNVDKFKKFDKANVEIIKKELNLNGNIVFASIGELNKNKNQIMQIEAMQEIIKQNQNVKLHINGVGVNVNSFKKFDKTNVENIKKELKLNDNIVFASIGELNKNKNQIMQIEAMQEITKQYPNVKLLMLGNGPLKTQYEEEIRNRNLNKNIELLGYRRDVVDILNSIDCLISTSKREGLAVNILEGLASGRIVIASDNRGNRPAIKNGETGFLIHSKEELIKTMKNVIENKEKIINKMEPKIKITIQEYSIEVVKKQLEEIYKSEGI